MTNYFLKRKHNVGISKSTFSLLPLYSPPTVRAKTWEVLHLHMYLIQVGSISTFQGNLLDLHHLSCPPQGFLKILPWKERSGMWKSTVILYINEEWKYYKEAKRVWSSSKFISKVLQLKFLLVWSARFRHQSIYYSLSHQKIMILIPH